jgi:ribonuclease HI
MIIYTDSMYSINCVTSWIHNWLKNGWKTSTSDVKNRDLIEELYSLAQGRDIRYIHVDGHSTCYGNNMADSLAVAGIDKQ